MNRRAFMASGIAASALAGAATAEHPDVTKKPGTAPPPNQGRALKGRIKQSVCRWCYNKMSLDDLCRNAADMGLQSVELLGEADWATTKQYNLACAVANGPSGIGNGWNRTENHDQFIAESERLLPMVAEAGIPNMIVFSGNRGGMDDQQGLRNCAAGLKQITALAEAVGVTVIMELLNSKVDHKDYMCDHTTWGVKLVNEVASDNFRLLYDIYHMQIMEGDVIRTIRDNKDFIAHYHTGGVPGRAEIDASQELTYGAICRAIVETGYTGYLGQEFIPRRPDAMASLKDAVRICDV